MANESNSRRATSVLVTICSSLIGVIAGATLQYFLTLKTQDARLWSEHRTKAYIQYVENSTKVNVLQREATQDPAKLAEARALRDSGRFLIALYGSKSVVDTMGRYTQFEKDPGSEDFRSSSTELFTAMRNDLMPCSDRVPAPVLRPVLFPEQVSQRQPN
jgi:hypothetical protein